MLRVFVEQAKQTYMGSMFIFDLCTGMRLGELLGLKWSDIDFDESQLHVERTISKVCGPDTPNSKWRLVLGPPRTPASERTIPLHQTAIKLLADVLNSRRQTKLTLGRPMRTMTLYSAQN